MRVLTQTFGLAVVFLALAGCGNSALAPAKGQIVYTDGTPAKELDGFNIVFEGRAPDGKPYSAIGVIDAEGRFQMFTTSPGDGAPIGSCKVLIEPKMIDSEREAPYPIDRKYRTFEGSGLNAEVTAKGPNDFKFTVEKKKR